MDAVPSIPLVARFQHDVAHRLLELLRFVRCAAREIRDQRVAVAQICRARQFVGLVSSGKIFIDHVRHAQRVIGADAALHEDGIFSEQVVCDVKRESEKHADAVAAAAWTQKREMQIEPRPASVMAERLPEVLLHRRNAPCGRLVPYAENADRRVDAEPFRLIPRAAKFPLQAVVHKAQRELQIVRKIADAFADEFRNNQRVVFSDRPHGVFHASRVEGLHAAVEAFQRIRRRMRIVVLQGMVGLLPEQAANHK